MAGAVAGVPWTRASFPDRPDEFFAARGLPYEPARLSFRSDYAAFHYAGVPVGGLFTGAEGVKTVAQKSVMTARTGGGSSWMA